MQRDKLKEILKNYTYSDYKNLYDKYRDWLVKEKVESSASFPNSPGEIAIFEFRCNEEISFNNVLFNNDLLVLMQVIDNSNGIKDHFFDVTTDPKNKKPGIAHTCEQIYRGNVGIHRGDPNRPCIRSDFGFGTWINRTDGKGNIIDINSSDKFTSAPLHCGINIHNGGEHNTSLGCTMFASDSEYQEYFRAVITHCSNKNNVPVALINAEDFEDILGLVESSPEDKEAEILFEEFKADFTKYFNIEFEKKYGPVEKAPEKDYQLLFNEAYAFALAKYNEGKTLDEIKAEYEKIIQSS